MGDVAIGMIWTEQCPRYDVGDVDGRTLPFVADNNKGFDS